MQPRRQVRAGLMLLQPGCTRQRTRLLLPPQQQLRRQIRPGQPRRHVDATASRVRYVLPEGTLEEERTYGRSRARPNDPQGHRKPGAEALRLAARRVDLSIVPIGGRDAFGYQHANHKADEPAFPICAARAALHPEPINVAPSPLQRLFASVVEAHAGVVNGLQLHRLAPRDDRGSADPN